MNHPDDGPDSGKPEPATRAARPASEGARPAGRPAPGQLSGPGPRSGSKRPAPARPATARPPAPRWAGPLAAVGGGLIAVVALQVLITVIEGILLEPGQPKGIPNEWYHRMGVPFGSLGGGAVLYLLVGLLLVVVPALVAPRVGDGHRTAVRVVVPTVAILSVVIALGSSLAVLNNLHEFSAQGRNAPTFVRLQLATFLLGALGTAAVTVTGALVLSKLARRRARTEAPAA